MAVALQRRFASGLETLGQLHVVQSNRYWPGGWRQRHSLRRRRPLGTQSTSSLTTDHQDIDIRNRGNVTFVYQPTFKIKNTTASKLANGFQFSGTEIGRVASRFIWVSQAPSVPAMAPLPVWRRGCLAAPSSGWVQRPTHTRRRLPQRISMPGFDDLDLRMIRNVPIHEKIYSVQRRGIQSAQPPDHHRREQYLYDFPRAGEERIDLNRSHLRLPAITLPSGSRQQTGCFVPYQGTGLSAFDTPSSTSSSNLYSSRQLQFSAKLFF